MDVAPGGGVDLRAPDEHVLPARFRIRHNGWNDDDDGRDVLTACVHQQALPSDRPLDHCDLGLGERGVQAFPVYRIAIVNGLFSPKPHWIPS